MFRGSLIFTSFAIKKDVYLRKMHLLRFACIGIVFLMFFSSWLSSSSVGAPGLDFFSKMIWLDFWLVTLAGIGIFSTAITEEKDEETLPLLKLAGISSLGLLLGKSTVRAVRIILLILAQVPFLLLAVGLGGITPLQIFATLFAMVAYVVLISNFALLCSVYARRSGDAIALVLIAMTILFLFPYLLSELVLNLQSRGLIGSQGYFARGIDCISQISQRVSVIEQFQKILTTGFSGSVISIQVVSNIVIGIICFLAAWACFESGSVRVAAGKSDSPVRKWKTRFRKHRPGNLALAWKEFQFTTGGKKAFLFKLLFYPLLILLVTGGSMLLDQYSSVSFISSFSWRGMMSTSLLLLCGGFVIESTLYVSQVFREERRQKMMPLLMLLPHSLARIMCEKILGVCPSLIPVSMGIILILLLAPDSMLVFADARWEIYIPLILAQYAVFLHLLAYYSLVVRWGALAFAIGTLILLEACLSPFLQIMYLFFHYTIGETGIIMPTFYLSLLSCFLLQFLITGRLHRIATEE
ncbi:hypothetical protein [Gimesia panareensis]|uniref:hypothetical protein n=1 Tax=Gimesia panareensis TaxID=2527978 RepID=UPI00118A0579|nr:hypothetical protein [Gimesia panareensis]QDU53514.1 ABC-2 family transporter protein [Gimesia panareensis]